MYIYIYIFIKRADSVPVSCAALLKTRPCGPAAYAFRGTQKNITRRHMRYDPYTKKYTRNPHSNLHISAYIKQCEHQRLISYRTSSHSLQAAHAPPAVYKNIHQ